jgi:hypothetical protein
MEIKICRKCKVPKYLIDFNKSTRNKDGRRSYCRDCENKDKRKYNYLHPDIARNYYTNNLPTLKEKQKIYNSKTKEQGNARKRKYVINNPEKRLEQSRNYYHRHKKEIKKRNDAKREINNRKRVEYINSNQQAKLAHNYRTLIWKSLKTKSNGGRLQELLGCNIDYFVIHLESLWELGMSWDNYGIGEMKWNVDHIIVLDDFDLTNYSQAKRAFHYTNTQPMWSSQNCSKSNRYNGKYKRAI